MDNKSGKPDVLQEFTANTDGDSLFTNTLFNPPQMRYLRFYPSRWNKKICMRVELYGCEVGPGTGKSTSFTTNYSKGSPSTKSVWSYKYNICMKLKGM